jgi:2-dehydro-3-deoxyphosphogluconate aldolase/(4S)-4-hydroxy-2-oxoglutarate aldolase
MSNEAFRSLSVDAAGVLIPAVSVLDLAPVIPVVAIEDVRCAIPVAAALLAGGIGVIEIILRTEAALDAVRLVSRQVAELVVGVGTVNDRDQVLAAVDAGADFLVSPGASERLLDSLQASLLPFLAGISTASDLIRLTERNIEQAKLFPAEAVGGTALLQALAGPFPQVRFCPTGGITAANARGYLQLPNVACVGASWLAPLDLQREARWDQITERARLAVALAE